MQEITTRLKMLTALVIKLTSLAETDRIGSEEDSLVVAPQMEEVPKTSEEIERLRAKGLSNDLYRKILFREDERGTDLLVEV